MKDRTGKSGRNVSCWWTWAAIQERDSHEQYTGSKETVIA